MLQSKKIIKRTSQNVAKNGVGALRTKSTRYLYKDLIWGLKLQHYKMFQNMGVLLREFPISCPKRFQEMEKYNP